MSLRNDEGKVANLSLRNDLLERQAIRDTTRFNDFGPENAEANPYVDGGRKANINPLIGKDRRYAIHNASNNNNGHNAHNKPNARSFAYANQMVYDGPGGSAPNFWEDRNSDFRGTRFKRGRGGGNGNRSRSPPRRRFDYVEESDHPDPRRLSGGEAWRIEDRRDDRRNDTRGGGRIGYGGRGQAK